MTPNEEDLFQRALAKPADQREAFLRRACLGDAVLLGRLETLLHAHDHPDGFLTTPAIGPHAASPMPTPGPGTRVGPYKLLQEIGGGGMGTVFMAEQSRPVQRMVAVKVIRPGMDSRAVIARFEAERQALALMDHPNIAKVLDAGTTESGLPYFVMELVKGVPITQFCDHNHLTPRQRLELFIPICHALQHAHQKGIIHRDLKPSNVLVALYDGRPVPKVIDFGVAKATGPKLTDRTLFTEFGALVGTLEYMSPEQAELNQLDIDTRTDVYTLGVLLYELLTGTTPLERKRLEGATFLEVLKIIREEEPETPSTRLGATVERAAIATARGADPQKLSGLLRGELDWIVMKALEKDRMRRYQTPNELANDVESYLSDEPVKACPPSVSYRLRKFARRNKATLLVASVGVVAVLVALGAVAGSIGWVLRDRDARQAKLAGDAENALARAELLHSKGQREDALAAMERAAVLAAQAGAGTPLLARLAALEKRLEAEQRDREFVERYQEIRRRNQSSVHWEQNRFAAERGYPEIEGALRAYRIGIGTTPVAEVVDRIRATSGVARQHLLAALNDCLFHLPPGKAGTRPWLVEVLTAADNDPWRARVRGAMGDLDALTSLAREVDVPTQPASFLLLVARQLRDVQARVDLLRRVQRTHAGDFWANHDLGFALLLADRPAEAVRYYTAAVALHPENAGVYLNRGNALRKAGELEAAIADYRRAVTLIPAWSSPHIGLAHALRETKDIDGALDRYRQAATLDPKNPEVYNGLGISLRAKGRLQQAIAAHRQAIAYRDAVPVAHRSHYYTNLGVALREAGDLEGAIAAQELAIRCDPEHARAHDRLGQARLAKGDYEEATACFRRAIAADPHLAQAHNNLGAALRKNKDLEGAAAAFRQAIAIDPGLPQAHYNLGWTLQEQGRLDEAIAAFRRAAAVGPGDANTYLRLGNALASKGDTKGAVACYRHALAIDPDSAWGHYNLGNTLLRQGDVEGAIASYRQAIAKAPGHAEALTNLGTALARQGDVEAAIRAHRRAIAANPNLAQAHNNLAAQLWQQGDLDGAVAAFQGALRVDPAYAMAHKGLGLVLLRRGDDGDHKAAIAALRQAVHYDPDKIPYHWHLVWALVTAPDPELRDVPAALKSARKTVAGRPASAGAWELLGWARYRAGDYQESIDALERSLALGKGGTPRQWLPLAMAHHRLGNGDKARKYCETAARWLEQHPDDELRRLHAEATRLLAEKK